MKISLPSNASVQAHRKIRSGFTLLEMVIVLGIIALIMGGAIFTMKNIQDGGRLQVMEGDFRAYDAVLQQYKNNAGHYPSEQQGLQALVEKPTSSPRPRRWISLVDKINDDPWGNPYVYKFPGSKKTSRPEIISYGPDGIADTDDDYSSQDE